LAAAAYSSRADTEVRLAPAADGNFCRVPEVGASVDHPQQVVLVELGVHQRVAQVLRDVRARLSWAAAVGPLLSALQIKAVVMDRLYGVIRRAVEADAGITDHVVLLAKGIKRLFPILVRRGRISAQHVNLVS
jgi:hypothetical protein